MEEVRQWFWEKKVERVIQALKKNEFDAEYFVTGEEAAQKAIELGIGVNSIGVAGSVTVRELNIIEVLKSRGKTVYDIWDPSLSPEEVLQCRRAQFTCDLFLTGTNALTLNGEIVNIDGTGNRVGAMGFGPQKVVIIAGVNKIVRDCHEAIRRIHEVASPMNCRRMRSHLKTPCGETGVCNDCKSPQRACRITTIINRRPLQTDISVYIIGEEMGF